MILNRYAGPLGKVKGAQDLRLDADTGRREVQMVLNRDWAMKTGITRLTRSKRRAVIRHRSSTSYSLTEAATTQRLSR